MTLPSNPNAPPEGGNGQLAAFVDRIIRLREEAKAINGDVREVYAEAKGNGFDKTVLGKIVSYVEKRATGAADLQEAEALFELYLNAYDGVAGTEVPLAHTHAREADANGDGPIRRMAKARQEIFDALEADGVIPGRDTGRSVYFLLAESAGLLKIGSSDDVRVRVRGLAGMSPVKLRLLGIVGGGLTRELQLHKQYAARRVHGEWFTVDDDFLDEIQDIVATHVHEAEETEAPTPLPVDQGQRAVASITVVQRPAEAKTSEKEPSEPEGSGEVQDGLPVHLPTPIRRTHNPDTHFLNSDGLVRLHGCRKPDGCGAETPRVKLCFSCSVTADERVPA